MDDRERTPENVPTHEEATPSAGVGLKVEASASFSLGRSALESPPEGDASSAEDLLLKKRGTAAGPPEGEVTEESPFGGDYDPSYTSDGWLSWPEFPERLPLPKSEVDHHLRALIDSGILILSSPDQGVVLSGAQALIEELGERREVLYREQGFLPAQVYARAAPHHTLIFDAREVQNLEDRLALARLSEQLNLQKLRQVLSPPNGALLLVLTKRFIEPHPSERGARVAAGLPVWHISTVEVLVRHWFPESSDEILSRLLRQQEEGLWPRDQRAFEEAVSRLGERLVEEMDRLGGGVEDASPPLPFDSPLHRAVLYAVGWFEMSSVRDFQAVLDVLLGDDREPALQIPQEENEAPPLPRAFKEIWREDYSTICKACRIDLRAVEGVRLFGDARSAQPTRVMFLSGPTSLRDEVRETFQGELVFDALRYLERIRSSALILESGPQLFSILMEFFKAHAAREPGRMGRVLLAEMLSRAVEVDDGALRSAWLIRDLASVNEDLRATCRAVLEEITAPLASADDLDGAGPGFVLEILENVLEADGVGVLECVHTIATSESEPVRFVGARLLARMMQNPVRAGEGELAHLASWLPEEARYEDAEIPIRSYVAIVAALEVCQRSIGAPREANGLLLHLSALDPEGQDQIIRLLWHPWSSAQMQRRMRPYTLSLINTWFVPGWLGTHLPDEGASLRLALALEWVQQLQSLRDHHTPTPGHQTGRDLFYAILLADWSVALQGLDEEPDPAGTERLDQLLQRTLRRTSRPAARRMVSYWSLMARSLLYSLEALRAARGPRATRAARRRSRARLRAMRARLRSLKASFIALERARRGEGGRR